MLRLTYYVSEMNMTMVHQSRIVTVNSKYNITIHKHPAGLETVRAFWPDAHASIVLRPGGRTAFSKGFVALRRSSRTPFLRFSLVANVGLKSYVFSHMFSI